jgi:hypothetical protein
MLNKLTNKKQGESMKTKRIACGLYHITTNKDVYEVENNLELNTLGWEISVQHNGEIEKIDTCASLKEAKSVIKMIEERA